VLELANRLDNRRSSSTWTRRTCPRARNPHPHRGREVAQARQQGQGREGNPTSGPFTHSPSHPTTTRSSGR
jgi:hypothetical protein